MNYTVEKYKEGKKRRFYFRFDDVALTDFFATDVANFSADIKRELAAVLSGGDCKLLRYNLYMLSFAGERVEIRHLYDEEAGLSIEESMCVLDTAELYRLVKAYCFRRLFFL